MRRREVWGSSHDNMGMTVGGKTLLCKLVCLFFLLDILPILQLLLFPVAPWTALKRAEDYIGIVWGTYRDCVMCKGLGIVWGTRRDCIRDKSALGLCEGQASFGCWTSMADQADANGTDSLIIRHILILPLRWWDRWLIYVWFDTNTNISCLTHSYPSLKVINLRLTPNISCQACISYLWLNIEEIE